MSDDVVKVTESGIVMVPDASISNAKVQDNAISLSKMAANSVDSSKIVDDSIVNADINSAAAIAKTKIAGTAITTADTGTVTSTIIANDTIVDADINSAAAINITKLSTPVVTQAAVGNLLTANQASVETNTTGFTNSNTTIARSTAQAAIGSASLLVTTTTSGTAIGYTLTGTSGVPVTPGLPYTATISTLQGTTVSGAHIRIWWYKSDGAASVVRSTDTAFCTVGTAWSAATVSGIAPSDAAYAAIGIYWTSAGAGETVYLDKFGFWLGTGGEWMPPGVPIPGAVSPTSQVYQGLGNLLPVNMSTFGDAATKWYIAGGTPTITNDDTYAYLGTRSCKIVASGVGNNQVWPVVTNIVAWKAPVIPGLPYTASFYARSDTAAENVRINLSFYKADGTTLATNGSTNSAYQSPSTTGWTRFMVTGIAPSDAVCGTLQFLRTSGTAGAAHWIDCAGFWQGTGGDWAPPGTPINGTIESLSSSQSSAVNMLSAGYTDHGAQWAGTNATVSSTTADKYAGSTSSIVLTTTSQTGGQAATSAPSASSIVHPAIPGEQYSFSAYAKLASGARYAYTQIQWYADAVHLSSTPPQQVHLTTADWTRLTSTGVAPATANAMRLLFVNGGTAALGSNIGDVVYWSGLTLNRGVGGSFATSNAPALGTMPIEAAYKVQVGNMLSPQEATGTDTLADASGFVPASCTLASSTSQYDRGSRSLELTATGGAAMTVYPGITGYNNKPCTPGVPYTAYFRVRNGTYSGQWYARLYFYTSVAGTATGSPFTGSTSTTVSSSGWTTIRHTVVAPADAAYVMPYLATASVANIGETAYVDSMGVWQGAGGEWAYPGTPIPNLGQYTDESVGRRIFVWDQVNQRYQMVYGDTGWRDVSGSLDADWTANLTAPAVLLRRVNNTVQGIFRVQRVTASGNRGSYDTVYTLPTGFTDGYYQVRSIAYSSTTAQLGFVGSGVSSSAIEVVFPDGGTYANGEVITFSFMSTTTTAWPTTLPGTASGTIPS